MNSAVATLARVLSVAVTDDTLSIDLRFRQWSGS